jgi:glucosamine-6-phosphate deaminase
VSLDLEVLAADNWAHDVGQRLTEAMAGHDRIRLCLATGNTTRPAYRQVTVSGDPTLYLLDEFGGLPPADPGRCETMFRRDFPEHPFRVPDVDSTDPIAAASAYAAEIKDGGLDLALVGVGANGHIGMNEPGSSAQSTTRTVQLAPTTSLGAIAYGATTRPTWGITVGIAELMDARELWLVVTGSHKAEILREALQSPSDPGLPASYLLEHPRAKLLADTAAARLL